MCLIYRTFKSAGRFVIGGISPTNWVVFVRAGANRWCFRTTDFDTFRTNVDPLNGLVEVNATSVTKKLRLQLRIQAKGTLAGFSPPLYIPTPTGFSNYPGCRETYTATAHIVVEDRYVEEKNGTIIFVPKCSLNVPLSALEFGGSFQMSNEC